MNEDDEDVAGRLPGDLVDSYHEALELELDECILDGASTASTEADRSQRRLYFNELFGLQGELVELPDRVMANGRKLVILVECRDAAGKGGEIKRITQRLNSRVCRVAALSAPNDREHTRFLGHIRDPLKQWKLSPMDLESRRRWEQHTTAKEIMLERTHIAEAPWWVVPADDKKKARLICISHLLAQVPCTEVKHTDIVLPERARNDDYFRRPVPGEMNVPQRY